MEGGLRPGRARPAREIAVRPLHGMLGWGLASALGVPLSGLATADHPVTLSQSLPDRIPLLDSLREALEPDHIERSAIPLDEQAVRELAALRDQALAAPSNTAQREQAGQAAWLLGLIYLHGAGVKPHPAKARQWFTLSLHHGEPRAPAAMAWCALDGCQTVPNLVQAQYWIQRLAPDDPARAAYFQWLIERQLHPLSPAASEGLRSQSAIGRHWLDKAVAAGHVHALIALGILHAQDHDLDAALALFERAAPQSTVARENAAWIRQHIALSRSPSPTPLAGSAPASSTQATFKAARDYHRGDGVSINYAEAIRLYRQADLEGSAAARRMLALIYSRTTPDGTLDPTWMRQLGDLDVTSIAPRQDAPIGISALRREATGLIDLLPPRWQQRIERP